jgi:hypothetical protein
MTSKHRRLIALNLVLLAALAVVTLAPLAGAQPAAARRPGRYTMVGGRIQGANTNAIYILDATNQELVAVRWDDSRKTLAPIGYRDLTADTQVRPGR